MTEFLPIFVMIAAGHIVLDECVQMCQKGIGTWECGSAVKSAYHV